MSDLICTLLRSQKKSLLSRKGEFSNTFQLSFIATQITFEEGLNGVLAFTVTG